MTFTQALLVAMMVVSFRRVEDRHPIRPQPWPDLIVEIIEWAAVALFYAIVWGLLGAGAQR